jgi:serine/threonine-protein kinase
MPSDRWQRLEQLYHSACHRAPAERAAFLDDACGGDMTLRRDLDSMLAQESRSFLETPALKAAAHLMSASETAALTGRTLGVYQIQGSIGAGGMGEVYRAHDTRLGRDVAIKVLPRSFGDDANRRERFEREAHMLAALNHPHIAQIYGFEELDGVRALVMELVEGHTLDEMISGGARWERMSDRSMTKALELARQIADALSAAHDKGIIHRDLKPANIKVREDGVVKVLDFGLAKALTLEALSSPDLPNSPTLSLSDTQPGFILGTSAYMPPEQALGKSVDKRCDIWAFGCVLYEMLAGRRAFTGADQSEILSCVITQEPDWSVLPPNTPGPIRRVLRRCLEKDHRRRLADVADARLDIEEALSSPAGSNANSQDQAVVAGRRRRIVRWVGAGAFAAALVLVLVFGSRSLKVQVSSPPLRVNADLGVSGAMLTRGLGANVPVAISPDGTTLAIVAQKPADAKPRLYVRRLDQLHAVLMPATDDASKPFFSPDGQWIAFFASGRLSKVSVSGGPPVTLCDAADGRGGDWTEDGQIVFAPSQSSGLFHVPSSGGHPQPLTTLENGEQGQRWPQVLPGGRAVLYTSGTGDRNDRNSAENSNIVVQPLPDGVRKVILRGSYYGRYLGSGHLVYVRDGIVFAAGFDLTRLELTGRPVPVLEDVSTNALAGNGQFAVSNSGALTYLTKGWNEIYDSAIDWVDRSGKSSPMRSTVANWLNLSFAPDGQQLALDIDDGKQRAVWIDDVARDTLTRLTVGPIFEINPVWTPDGRRVVFASLRSGRTYNLFWRLADGTGNLERLTNSNNLQLPGAWHPSGKILAFEEQGPSNSHVMLMTVDGDEASGWKPGQPTVFLSGPFDQRRPSFSPDGRWLAYESNESGQFEVYVRAFPGPGSKRKISTAGGLYPVWSRTRHELLYSTVDQRIMTIAYSVDGDSFRAQTPQPWPEARYTPTARLGDRRFTLHPDGNRIALAPIREMQRVAQHDRIVFDTNFFEQLRRIVPVTNR